VLLNFGNALIYGLSPDLWALPHVKCGGIARQKTQDLAQIMEDPAPKQKTLLKKQTILPKSEIPQKFCFVNNIRLTL
jgi:hypothetical protein